MDIIDKSVYKLMHTDTHGYDCSRTIHDNNTSAPKGPAIQWNRVLMQTKSGDILKNHIKCAVLTISREIRKISGLLAPYSV